MDVEFRAELWEWRGPAPYYWLTMPEAGCELVRAEAREASSGGVAIPVRVRIGGTEWETSLLPRDGGDVVPVKNRVRAAERIAEGDLVAVGLSVAPRAGRAANGAGPTG